MPAFVTFGILVVEPPVTTVAGVTDVTTVFLVTTVGVFVVQVVMSSAEIAVPAVADPTVVVLRVTAPDFESTVFTIVGLFKIDATPVVAVQLELT